MDQTLLFQSFCSVCMRTRVFKQLCRVLRCISTAMASLQSIATRHHRCRAHVHCVQPYGINNYNWVRRRASQPARPDSLRRFDDVKCSATSEWLLTASKLKRRSHCCKLCSAAQYCGQHVCVYMQIKCSKYHAKWRRKTTSAICFINYQLRWRLTVYDIVLCDNCNAPAFL